RHEQETTKGHDQILRKQAIESALTILRRLSVPATEIRKPKLVQERSQTGYRESGAVELTLGKEQLGPSWVSVSRQIEGIPVFSSRALIQLRDRQGLSFLEVHWPEISRDTVAEAHRLSQMLKEGWLPPRIENAKPESMSAGIVHSPALGFVYGCLSCHS